MVSAFDKLVVCLSPQIFCFPRSWVEPVSSTSSLETSFNQASQQHEAVRPS